LNQAAQSSIAPLGHAAGPPPGTDPKNRDGQEELKEAYALARAAITAADLAKYAELDEGVPFDGVLAELEEAEKQREQKPQ
jgi:hypothetical protein